MVLAFCLSVSLGSILFWQAVKLKAAKSKQIADFFIAVKAMAENLFSKCIG
ncbi:hypothetical protein [Adhaeribacter radiodurans]|uniref:Uncharacterized protein n=1 Tax=Adhaeribacter radiodurans TaxID=2745197 RepID=A0A7L7L1L1_9BACT|nr:hypothetical protein [Adhaeribacter radiodurans]QMU26676.1 hypothetical protein HUW48_00910 [Adhaeribacter radiodurans]